MTTPVPVRSLAEMKRVVATPGVEILAVEHWQPHLRGLTRTPVRVQSNAYTFMAANYKGEIVEQWGYYPKAAELRFNDDGTVTFYPDTARSWRLAFAVPA